MEPLSICLEDLDEHDDKRRFLRCVAVARRGDGIGFDLHGAAVWQGETDLSSELIVSMDDRLLLVRHAEVPDVVVHRAGRSLHAPVGKRVVLIDQDQLDVASRRLRVHVHGPAVRVERPTFWTPRAIGAATLAAAVALAAGSAGCKEVAEWIEVRSQPPEPPPVPSDAGASASSVAPGPSTPIEARDKPPEYVRKSE